MATGLNGCSEGFNTVIRRVLRAVSFCSHPGSRQFYTTSPTKQTEGRRKGCNPVQHTGRQWLSPAGAMQRR